MFKLYMILAYTFFKPYIFKVCNGFSLYIIGLKFFGFYIQLAFNRAMHGIISTY